MKKEAWIILIAILGTILHGFPSGIQGLEYQSWSILALIGSLAVALITKRSWPLDIAVVCTTLILIQNREITQEAHPTFMACAILLSITACYRHKLCLKALTENPAPILLAILTLWIAVATLRHGEQPYETIPTILTVCMIPLATGRGKIIAYTTTTIAIIGTWEPWGIELTLNRSDRIGFALLAIGMLICVESRIKGILITILSACVLIGESGTGKLTLVALGIIAILGIIGNKWGKIPVIGLSFTILIGGIITWPSITNAVGKSPTMTGRVEIWKINATHLRENIWVGNGRDFWKEKGKAITFNDNRNGIQDSFNRFIDLGSKYGIPAVTLLIGILIGGAYAMKEHSITQRALIIAVWAIPSQTQAVWGLLLLPWILFTSASNQNSGEDGNKEKEWTDSSCRDDRIKCAVELNPASGKKLA